MRWWRAAARPRSSWAARSALDASLSGWVTIHNQPIISNRLNQDGRIAPALVDWLEQYRVESAALAPLVIKGQVVGTLVLIKGGGKGGFDQADLDLLVSFADQAAIAIENARLYEEAQQVAASQERSRLARDLHDAVTQTLFSASLIAEALPALWESDPAEGRQLLGDLRQLTRGALAEMRSLLLELRPAALIEANLGDLLRQLAESVSGRSGIPVAVSLEGCPVPDLPDDVHVALYRIAQEALNNVVKHAQAKRVEVALRCERGAEAGGSRFEKQLPAVRSGMLASLSQPILVYSLEVTMQNKIFRAVLLIVAVATMASMVVACAPAAAPAAAPAVEVRPTAAPAAEAASGAPLVRYRAPHQGRTPLDSGRSPVQGTALAPPASRLKFSSARATLPRRRLTSSPCSPRASR